MAQKNLMIRIVIFFGVCLPLIAPKLAFSDSLIDEATAQAQGLTRPWFSQVQMDRSQDHVQSTTLFDGMLLLQTRRGVIQAFDGETGETLWVTRVGSPTRLTTPVGASADHAAVVNGSNLFLFERMTGKHLWSRLIGGGIIAAPGISKEYIFVPKVNGILEAYSIDDPKIPTWKHNAHGRAMVQPIVENQSVGWPTDRGAFYVARTSPPEIVFRTETYDTIVAPPAYIRPHFYIGSADGYLYKVDERTGDIKWRFSTGEVMANRPVAVDGYIYVTAEGGGLYRVLADKSVAEKANARTDPEANQPGDEAEKVDRNLVAEEGKEVWRNPKIARLLAVTPQRIFGMDNQGTIQIVSTITGRRLGTITTEDISLAVINHVSDRIYLVTDDGLVQCLHDTRIRTPILHRAANPSGKKDVKDDVPPTGDDKSNESDTNPFENDSETTDDSENPFGKSETSETEDAEGESENPFQ